MFVCRHAVRGGCQGHSTAQLQSNMQRMQLLESNVEEVRSTLFDLEGAQGSLEEEGEGFYIEQGRL